MTWLAVIREVERLREKFRDEVGQSLVEYALIIAFVVLFATPGILFCWNALEAYMGAVAEKVEEEP